MSGKKIRVTQYLSSTKMLETREYLIPSMPRATLLQALEYIYEELDPALAFRYGCRYKRCGLCGVMVNGKPRLACKVKLESVEDVAPLANLPLLRGLTVDRSAYMKTLDGLQLYPKGKDTETLGHINEVSLHKNLMHCVECLCCVASCVTDGCATGKFAGPFALVKLAQLHLDTRDTTDRVAQAVSLGFDKCVECKKCVCPNGIRLQDAIELFSVKT